MSIKPKLAGLGSVGLSICFSCLILAPVWAGDLRLGRADVNITPPVGMPMGGYFYLRLSTRVHDDLHAKALVLEKDGVKVALVACDLVGVPARIANVARQLIERTSGLKGEQVMISGTHTHTGPEIDPIILASAQGQTARIVHEYYASLPAKIAESVKLAEASLVPARAWAAVGHENSLSFNRRFLMKDGTVRFNPGKMNPDIVRPVGPIDPDVAVVYFDTPDSKSLATYVNFPLHLDTVGRTAFSADYPHTLDKLAREVKGREMMTLFTIGTAGNINHLDVKSDDRQQGHEEAARIGTVLASEVLKTYARMKSPITGPLKTAHETVRLPVLELKPGELERSREVVERSLKPGLAGPEFLETVNAFKVLNVAERQGKPIEAEVQLMTLGDELAWVGLPGEIFVELGLAIKLASPFPTTIICELANDVIDYVPNRKAFAEGGYEVVTAQCTSGSGEILVETATRLLVETSHFKSGGHR
jgi:neutral ceramidase